MRKIQNLIFSIIAASVLYSCSEASGIAEKKAQLEANKKQLAELEANIRKLESEIANLDTTFKPGAESVLVSTYEVKPEPFIHQIEVRGAVESRKNVMLSAETMGRIEQISVNEGQEVSKGTLLIKLDADVLENNIAEVKTQLELAETTYQRQKNLWEQNIGSEMQYLKAKNDKESLERRLKTLNSQLRQAYVRAPFSGVVDVIPVKVGEMAQPGLPLIRIVNQKQMYIKADVSETYMAKVKSGDEVAMYFPTQDIRMKSTIASVGRVINEENRTFSVEVSIPQSSGHEFRPNQIVMLKLTDYQKEDALSVPTKIIQSDEEGKYLYALGVLEGKKVVRKVRVSTGKSFNNHTEIHTGLKGGEYVIDEGYRDVSEGTEVSLSTASL